MRPRAVACSSLSTISVHGALATARTRRGRASNGREAVSGSGFFVSAVIWANAATVSGSVADSEPPATTRSNVPERISRSASNSAWLLEEQAEIVAKFAPVRPNRIAMWPAGAFAISIGTMNGRDAARAPSPAAPSAASRSVSMPADPRREDHAAAVGHDLGVCRRPARRAAPRPAPNCVNRSVRRASFVSRKSAGVEAVDLAGERDRQIVDRERG